MGMNSTVATLNWNKNRRFSMLLFAISFVVLISGVNVLASELGGYVSEKLIGRSGVSNSQLVIGGNSNSLLDIELNSTEGTPATHMNPSDPAYRLAAILPTIFVAIAIVLLVGMVLSGTMSLPLLILAVVLIMVGVAGAGAIQEAVIALLH